MGLQNRVTPYSALEHSDARGMFMGNRGCLHDDRRTVIRARSSVQAWVCCRLQFKGRKRTLMSPGKYTELFFLDEATALAAGHRPCAECRRTAFNAFKAAWERAFGTRPSATDMNKAIFPEMRDRLAGAPPRAARLCDLPDGVLVEMDPGQPAIQLGGLVLPWSHHGYGPAREIPRDREVTVLTPAATTRVLAGGYQPTVHGSAGHPQPPIHDGGVSE